MSSKGKRDYWFFGSYAVTQISIQLIGMVCGFLIIRQLPKEQFSLFTIFNTALATLNILGDSGLGSALFALAGPLTDQPAQYTRILSNIVGLRLRFMVVSCLITLPITMAFIYRAGSSTVDLFMLFFMLLLSTFAAAENVPLIATMRLKRDVSNAMRFELASALLRLVIILLALWIGMNLFAASYATLASTWLLLVLLRNKVQIVHSPEPLTLDERNRVRQIVLHSLPMVLFSATQGQLAHYLLCAIGTNDQIADIGAIARFFVAFVIIQQPIQHFLIPSIARAQTNAELRRKIRQTIGFTMLLGIGTWIGIVACTPICLWILGPQYQHLSVPFTIAMFSCLVGLISTVLWSISLARGWTRFGWMQIPLAIVLMAFLAPQVRVDNISSTIIFGMAPTLASLLIALATVWIHLKSGQVQPDPGETPTPEELIEQTIEANELT